MPLSNGKSDQSKHLKDASMESASSDLLIVGDWGLHCFEFEGHRAQAECGSKLIERALKELLKPLSITSWLSNRPTISKSVLRLEMLPRLIDGQPDPKNAKVRIAGSPRNVRSDGNDPILDYKTQPPAAYDALLIHDAAGAWRKHTTEEQISKLLDADVRSDTRPSNILIHVCRELPEIQRHDGNAPVQFKDAVWKNLDTEGVRERVHVLCSITPVRKAGCAVSRRLSWEQTVED